MDDMLDIPEFLRRPAPTPEELAKLRRKRPGTRVAAPDNNGWKVKRDKDGNPLPKGMDESTKAYLESIAAAERVKAREAEKAKQERFRVLAVARAEKAAIKKAAKEASKLNATKF
jgi:hypothetical protein